MSEFIKRSDRRGVTSCAILFGAFVIFIANWRSAIGLRSFSPNVDLLTFSFAVTVIPLALFWRGGRLPNLWRHLTRAVALCALLFAVLVWLWNFRAVGRMTHGSDVEPLLTSVPFGNGRIAAYEVETAPAGAYVSLRLQYTIVPGVFLSREFAVVNAPTFDELTLLSPTQLCITFPSLQADLTGRHDERQVVVLIAPLFKWHATSTIEPETPSSKCAHRTS
jgi:hypothetical protein